ncbi:MAG: glycine cleavage T C-terminal barrel domain-containing protein, partial [Alphaproteobacteria bacterium]
TPQEAAMSWAVSRRKPFFVGGRAVAMREKRPLTRQLVGFEITADSPTSIEECHLVLRGGEITGRVTSVSLSPTLGKVIGLAYVAPDQAQAGSVIEVKAAGGAIVSARVVELPFYDPENRRQEL